jgi:hypothetical protein
MGFFATSNHAPSHVYLEMLFFFERKEVLAISMIGGPIKWRRREVSIREASGGVRCVYGWWTHMTVMPSNASKVRRMSTLNKRVAIPIAW